MSQERRCRTSPAVSKNRNLILRLRPTRETFFPTPDTRGGRQVRAELKKVAWPSRQELESYTVVVLVSVASADDGTFAPNVLARLTAEHRTRLRSIWADGKYHNHHLNDWLIKAA